MFNLIFKFLLFSAAFVPLMFAFLTEDCKHQKVNNGNQTKSEANKKMEDVKTGSWGGDHIRLDVTENGATIDYDCAHGTIDRKIVPDAAGQFDAVGTHVREHGGPIRKDEEENAHPARYSGQIQNDKMTLTVTETDKNITVGTFTLVYGENGRVMKCK